MAAPNEERKRKRTSEDEECENEEKLKMELDDGERKEDVAVIKMKRKKKKPPSIKYDLVDLFSMNGKRPNGSYLHFADIRTLILLTVHGDRFPCYPTWCTVINFEKIKKTLVIQVSGISEIDYKENKKEFQNLQRHFTEPVIPLQNEGNDRYLKSPTESLLFYRMPKRLLAEKTRSKQKEYEEQPNTLKNYLLTEERLRANDFPQWNSAAAEHGVITTRGKEGKQDVNDESEIFAIDCEMCEVKNGLETALTRISIVNQKLETVYDTFVKPKDPITDYVTQYSGITAEILRDVTTTLKQVQKKLLKIIKPTSVLVGHSLDFDLRALKLHHDHVVDTSELYQDHRGANFKPALRFLTSTYLKRSIQSSNKGHCSIEDAKACMELVNLKLNRGKTFGKKSNENESIFEAVTRAGKRGSLVESKLILSQHTCQRPIECSNDEEVVNGVETVLKDVDFVFAHLKSYKELITGKMTIPSKEERTTVLKGIDQHLHTILASVPPDTLVVISFSSGYIPPNINEMLKDREERKKDIVKSSLKVAKCGVCFVKITK